MIHSFDRERLIWELRLAVRNYFNLKCCENFLLFYLVLSTNLNIYFSFTQGKKYSNIKFSQKMYKSRRVLPVFE